MACWRNRGSSQHFCSHFVCLGLAILSLSITAQNQQIVWKGKIVEENGLKTVINPEEPVYGEIGCELAEELCLGQKPKEEQRFWWLLDVLVDEEENIYLLEYKNYRIQIFNKAGLFLRSIGGFGQGPAEFQRPQRMVFDDNFNLVVRDGRFLKIFDRSGSHLDSIATEFSSLEYFPTRNGFLSIRYKRAGELKSLICLTATCQGISKDIREIADGTLRKKVPQGDMSVTTGFEENLHLARIDPDHFIYGASHSYEFSVINAEGKPLYRIRKDEPKPTFTAAQKRFITKIGGIVPNVKPYFFSLIVDSLDRIHVMREPASRLPAESADKYDLSNTPVMADVFSREGVFLYRTKLPFNTRVIHDGYLYMIKIRGDDETLIKYKVSNWDRLPRTAK